jgi:FkbM family methyltransferase
MLENLYVKLLMWIVSFIDLSNKKKIINYFKSQYKNAPIIVLDIGTHKGETIDFFIKNLNIDKIYSCEPNVKIFSKLKKNKKYQNNKIKLFNLALGNTNEKKELNILKDSSSSTFNKIDIKTKYFERKKKIISYFSKSSQYFVEKQIVQICKTSDFIKNNFIKNINILKIDTEGYEYNILQGIEEDQFKFIKLIYFEHHYDLMLRKKYKFRDINELLIKKGFKKCFKIKMKFRKTFEYIYRNER